MANSQQMDNSTSPLLGRPHLSMRVNGGVGDPLHCIRVKQAWRQMENGGGSRPGAGWLSTGGSPTDGRWETLGRPSGESHHGRGTVGGSSKTLMT